jgi:hypothetical protein
MAMNKSFDIFEYYNEINYDIDFAKLDSTSPNCHDILDMDITFTEVIVPKLELHILPEMTKESAFEFDVKKFNEIFDKIHDKKGEPKSLWDEVEKNHKSTFQDLIAHGASDRYLTGNPQIQFFKVAYRQHTNFANV